MAGHRRVVVRTRRFWQLAVIRRCQCISVPWPCDFNESAAVNLADELGLDIPDCFLATGTPRVVVGHETLRSLRSFTDRLFGRRSPVLHEDDEEKIVIDLLLAANCNTRSADKSAPVVRARGLARALEMMLAYETENLSIGQICSETGTSWRTLDRAFRETFGIGPKRYYLNLRLNRVRSRLIGRGELTSISDAANEYGFWHLGEFARQYSSLFGELPTQSASAHQGSA
ncbi:MAG: helix-turn-helix domain-containing protein [Hyphomicrobiales bacterium]|nr:helix-turn-helix domain-containing protein [Hyphomicrobiales bacterium]